MKIKSNLKTIKQKKEIKKFLLLKKKSIKSKKVNKLNLKITKFLPKKKNLTDNRYKIFTKEFDLSVNAKSLASKSELNSLRKKI